MSLTNLAKTIMKILIITQWYDPEPIFKGQLFARKLVEAGHDVEVITGFPNYPGGKVYDGYKIKPWQVEWIDGVKVCRVALYPSHDNSGLRRALNYISFAASSFLWALIRSRGADVIYAYHPPLTTALCGTLVGKLKGIPSVIDIQDLWPDTLKAMKMINSDKVLGIVDWVCRLTYKMASHIVVLSPGFKTRISQRGVAPEKIDVIYNWCDEDKLGSEQPCRYQLPESEFTVLFAGNIGAGQGVMSIVEAAKILSERSVKADIVFVGNGIALEDAKNYAATEQLENIHFIPRVPMEEVGELLNKADSLLVHLTRDELFTITIPSKIQAYMAQGRPIICGVSGDANDVIRQAECGVTCNPEDPESLADAIEKIRQTTPDERKMMGENAADYYQKNMSSDEGVSRFISLFKRLSGKQ